MYGSRLIRVHHEQTVRTGSWQIACPWRHRKQGKQTGSGVRLRTLKSAPLDKLPSARVPPQPGIKGLKPLRMGDIPQANDHITQFFLVTPESMKYKVTNLLSFVRLIRTMLCLHWWVVQYIPGADLKLLPCVIVCSAVSCRDHRTSALPVNCLVPAWLQSSATTTCPAPALNCLQLLCETAQQEPIHFFSVPAEVIIST